MEFSFSAELPALTNPTGGLAGAIPVRRNLHGVNEEIGASQARQDWQKFMGKLDNFHGSASPKYGLMQVAVPECLPDRLSIIAYASEIGFLYDDSTELMSQVELERANDEMQHSFNAGAEVQGDDRISHGLTNLQAKLVKEMKRIDAPRAHTAIKAWGEFLQQAAGREHEIPHESFDAYMQYRLLDVGEMFWFGLVTFGMALTIPDDEILRLRQLTRPCWKVLALQNDLCSYKKEVEAAKAKGASHVVNALWFLMRDHKVDLPIAMRMCKQHIERCVAEYDQIVTAHRMDETLSKDCRIYLEALRYTISGDAAWSLICPRYNQVEVKL